MQTSLGSRKSHSLYNQHCKLYENKNILLKDVFHEVQEYFKINIENEKTDSTSLVLIRMMCKDALKSNNSILSYALRSDGKRGYVSRTGCKVLAALAYFVNPECFDQNGKPIKKTIENTIKQMTDSIYPNLSLKINYSYFKNMKISEDHTLLFGKKHCNKYSGLHINQSCKSLTIRSAIGGRNNIEQYTNIKLSGNNTKIDYLLSANINYEKNTSKLTNISYIDENHIVTIKILNSKMIHENGSIDPSILKCKNKKSGKDEPLIARMVDGKFIFNTKTDVFGNHETPYRITDHMPDGKINYNLLTDIINGYNNGNPVPATILVKTPAKYFDEKIFKDEAKTRRENFQKNNNTRYNMSLSVLSNTNSTFFESWTDGLKYGAILDPESIKIHNAFTYGGDTLNRLYDSTKMGLRFSYQHKKIVFQKALGGESEDKSLKLSRNNAQSQIKYANKYCRDIDNMTIYRLSDNYEIMRRMLRSEANRRARGQPEWLNEVLYNYSDDDPFKNDIKAIFCTHIGRPFESVDTAKEYYSKHGFEVFGSNSLDQIRAFSKKVNKPLVMIIKIYGKNEFKMIEI